MIDSTDRKSETISKAELYNLLANEVPLPANLRTLRRPFSSFSPINRTFLKQ